MGHYQAIYLAKPKTALILQQVYKHAAHLKSKIILDYTQFCVYQHKIAADICKYICVYLSYVKWVTSAKLLLLTFIQNKEPYKLMEINFINFFKRFVYKNLYIYKLIN